MEPVSEKPTLQEQRVASDSLVRFTQAIANRTTDRVTIQLQDSNEVITLPRKALELLTYILSGMAEGKTITLIPADAELTTQQAADRLQISRPHLIKLLETGVIPFKRVGSHRRIALEDLQQYESTLQRNRRDKLQFLAEQAQDLQFGYE